MSSSVVKVDLGGEWTLRGHPDGRPRPAAVPGVVHTALMATGDLPDVRTGEQERQQLWVGDTVWTYERKFTVTAEVAEADCLELVAEGLDTLATVELDGVEIGRTANMFRTWTWDLSGRLAAGPHTLRITFAAVPPYLAEKERERTLYQWNNYFHYAGRGWVRKMPPATCAWRGSPMSRSMWMTPST